MGKNPGGLIDGAAVRTLFARLTAAVNRLTCRMARGSTEETIAEIDKRWHLDEHQRQFLGELDSRKSGAAFIDEKIQDINRAAFHRSAFALNAFIQLLFVDLPAQLSLSFFPLKLMLVIANVLLVLVAHTSMRTDFRSLLAGPNTLPPKRRCWGLLSNPRYNKAVKKHSRPHARAARKEKSFYRPAYFGNAVTIFFGDQFIIPADKLIFPFSFIVGKVTGLVAALVMVFDVWRGIRAGDDARQAGEREVSVYRDLDI